MRFELDCSMVMGRRDLHEKLAVGLALPHWYGMNLDALYDCLTEPGEERVLALDRPDKLNEALGAYSRVFLRVLEDAAEVSGSFRLDLNRPSDEDNDDIES